MLLNIQKMRGMYCFSDYLALAKKLDFTFVAPDQDLLNLMHWKHVHYISQNDYDLFARYAHNQNESLESVEDHVFIIHYTGSKPWNNENTHFPIEKVWWDYASMTPFYTTLLEDFVSSSLFDTSLEQTLHDLYHKNQELESNLYESIQLSQKLLLLLNHTPSNENNR